MGKSKKTTRGKTSVRKAEAAPPKKGVQNSNILPFSHFEGFLRNPEKIKIEQLELMVRTDETVSASIEFLTLAVTNRIGQYVHDIPAVQDLVRQNFDQMNTPFKGVIREILTGLWAGFSASEIVWMPNEDGLSTRLDSIHTLKPNSVSFVMDLSRGERHGEVDGIKQWVNTDLEQFIAWENLIIYSHRKRFGNPYGNSRLQSVYKNWWMKDVILKAYTRTLERYGSPLVVGTVDGMGAEAIDPQTGEMSTRGKIFLKKLNNLHNCASMVKEKNQILEFIQSSGSIGKDFKDCLEYLNRMIGRGNLIPSLIFDNTDTGSRSLGETHMDVLALNVESIIEEVSDAIIEQVVKRLIFHNVGDIGDWGSFDVQEVRPENVEMWAKVIKAMTGVNVIDQTDLDDLNCSRSKIGFEPTDKVPEAKPTPPGLGNDNPFEEEGSVEEKLFADMLRAEIVDQLA